jgi:hypothetical protein
MGGKKTCKVEATLMIKNDENKKVFKRNFSHVFYSKRTKYGCVSCPLVTSSSFPFQSSEFGSSTISKRVAQVV